VRLLRTVILTAAAWLALPCAYAQAANEGPQAYVDTVSYGNANKAYATSALIYGVTNQVDRALRERQNPTGLVFDYNINLIFNAVSVPGKCTGDINCPKDGYSLQQVDIMSGSLTLGYCHGDKPDEFSGCFFGATGFTGAVAAPGIGTRMIIDGFMVPLAPVIGGMYAVGISEKGGGDTKYVGGITPSYIVGYGGNIPGFGEVRLGYLDNYSRAGWYTNVTVTRIRGFVSAALTDGLKTLPFLNTGFRDLMPGGEELAERIGASTLSARKLDFSPPAPAGLEQPRDVINMWTAHARQVSMYKIFDLGAAAGWQPSAFLHELTAGVHTPNFAVPRGPDGKPIWKDEGGFAAALHAGMVELPKLPYYGVTGGKSFYFSAAVEARAGSRDSNVRFRVGLRRNDPEVLASFPFAQNAMNFYLQFMGGF